MLHVLEDSARREPFDERQPRRFGFVAHLAGESVEARPYLRLRAALAYLRGEDLAHGVADDQVIGGAEAVLLFGEVLVERVVGDPCRPYDAGDGERLVAGFIHELDRRCVDAGKLVLRHLRVGMAGTRLQLSESSLGTAILRLRTIPPHNFSLSTIQRRPAAPHRRYVGPLVAQILLNRT